MLAEEWPTLSSFQLCRVWSQSACFIVTKCSNKRLLDAFDKIVSQSCDLDESDAISSFEPSQVYYYAWKHYSRYDAVQYILAIHNL